MTYRRIIVKFIIQHSKTFFNCATFLNILFRVVIIILDVTMYQRLLFPPEYKDFLDFLQTIPLAAYREKYSSCKTVEQDLPKEIQILKLIYVIYWEQKDFLLFDGFYSRYLNIYKKEIESYRQKIGFTSALSKKADKGAADAFHRGLEARMYRTWVSILTQIQAAYEAETVFGKDAVSMSEELDRGEKVDFRIKYRGYTLDYQVKKESQRKEALRVEREEDTTEKHIKQKIVYRVAHFKTIQNPYKQRKNKNGEREYLVDYIRNVLEATHLKYLSNGFATFNSNIFQKQKEEID